MTLLVQPKESLLVGLGKQFTPPFSKTELISSNNAMVSDAVDPSITLGKNSIARVTMNKAGYSGNGASFYQQKDSEKTAQFYFDRLDLSSFASILGSLFKIDITGTKPTNAFGIINNFNQTFGIELSTADISNTTISWTGDVGTVSITAVSGSLGFKGTASLTVNYSVIEQGTAIAGVTTTLAAGTARYDCHMVHYNNKLYVYGGYKINAGVIVDAVYDIAANTWSTRPTLTLNYPVVYGSYIYLYNSTNGVMGRYDPSNDTTTSLATNPNALAGLIRTQVLVVGDNIYVIGGRTSSGTAVATVHCYNITNNTWSVLASIPEPIMEAGGSVVSGEIYLMGGWNATTTSVKNYKYNPLTNTWTTRADIPTSKRFAVAVNVRNWVYLIGGIGSNTILRYDPVTNGWTQLPQTIPAVRYIMGYAQSPEYIYLFAGLDNASQDVNTLWRIN